MAQVMTEDKTIMFGVKEEIALLTAFENVIHQEEEWMSEEEALKREKIACMDGANVLMVIAHSVRARRFLARFVPKDSKIKIPELCYDLLNRGKDTDLKKKCSMKVGMEYLTKAIAVFTATGEETLRVSIHHDYPITLKTDDFEIIIAPRVEE